MNENLYSNPLAPQWMFPDWGYRQFCETEFAYTFPLVGTPFTIGTGGLVNQALQFSFDSEFHITDWQVYGVNTAQATVNTGIEVRLTDSAAKWRINNFVTVQQACGFVPKDWVISPGGVQRIDFRNTTGGSVTVLVVFRGYKRFQNMGCPPLPPGFVPVPFVPLWARYSSPPPGFVDEPFCFDFPTYALTAPSTLVMNGVPFPLDTDAPFLLRGVEFNDGASDPTTSVNIRIVTPQGNRLVLQSNPSSLATPYALGTNAANTTFLPALGRAIYPEVICPAGSVLAMDFKIVMTAGTASGDIRFNGVKRQVKGQS